MTNEQICKLESMGWQRMREVESSETPVNSTFDLPEGVTIVAQTDEAEIYATDDENGDLMVYPYCHGQAKKDLPEWADQLEFEPDMYINNTVVRLN